MHQIVLLASEDRVFPAETARDAAEAAEERGFFFSEEGQARLHPGPAPVLERRSRPPSASSWGGVRFYN